MIRVTDHKQEQLFDPWDFISPVRRQLPESSWPGLFNEVILRDLPITEIAPYFSQSIGRPTKELHTVIGVLILQQTHDLTDAQSVEQLAFNIQWHYALNITEESDSAKYMCPKTLWNMRNIIVENGLETVISESVTDKLATVFNVDTD